MKQRFYVMLCALSISLVGIKVSFAESGEQTINGYTVGKVIPGYNCLLVKLPPEAEAQQNFHMFPKVFAAPTEGSKEVGQAMGVVYVVWPLNKINGFYEMLLDRGRRGWVAAKDTKPFTYPISSNTPGRCEISMSVRGGIGFKGYSLSSAKQQ
jgi:hypothetical protein